MEDNTDQLNQLKLSDIEEIKKDTCFSDYNQSSVSVYSLEESQSHIDEINNKHAKNENKSKFKYLIIS